MCLDYLDDLLASFSCIPDVIVLFLFHPSNAGVLTVSLKLGSSRSPRALRHEGALLSETRRAGQSWLPAVAAVAGLHPVSALLFPLLFVRT